MKSSILATLLAGLATSAGLPDYEIGTAQRVDVEDYPRADLDSLRQSSGSYKAANKAAFGAIKSASSTILTPQRSIDSLFLRLPSSAELDELILSADSVAILKTIQTVATDDSLTCEQRIAYLLELLGRIRCAIEKKQFAADQLRIIIDGANQEIRRLQSEIEKLQQAITDLWLDELKDKLAAAVAKLEDAYRQFNAVEGNIAPNEAKVAGYENEIAILIKNSDAERNRIANDRLKLTEVEANIRNLETQLQSLRNRKAALEESIRRSEAIIRENDAKIEEARARIRELEAEIRRLRDQADALRAQVSTLEIQVERLRTDISVAEAKKDRFLQQIRDLEDRINIERKKIATDELDDLLRMIETLQKLIPTTESEIDRHYYYCYGEGSVEVEQTGSTVVYIVKGERFGDYIQKAYRCDAPDGYRDRNEVRLYKFNIYAKDWTAKFGYPQVNTSYSQKGFDGAFSCLNPSACEKSEGVIEDIGSDYIEVHNKNKRRVKLQLSSCSRVEATTQYPKIGQKIYYSAEPSSAGGYNLYTATCVGK